jgi:hypothetical protein
MSQIVTKITAADLQMLKDLEKNSTQVVGWYAHPGNVRGPFNRWFNVTPVDPQYQKHCGTAEDDCKYAAAAMNYLPKLIERIEQLESQLAIENMLMGVDDESEMA